MSSTTELRVLVVDDEEDIREILAFYLSRRVKAVKTAKDGAEAFELCKVEDFDVVITDIMMPGSDADGVTLIKNLRATWPNRHVIVVITGRSNESEQQILSSGANTVLYKPFTFEAIISAIQGQ